jgi:hypothetical protein
VNESGKKSGRMKQETCPALSIIVRVRLSDDLPYLLAFRGGSTRKSRLGQRTAAVIRRLAG